MRIRHIINTNNKAGVYTPPPCIVFRSCAEYYILSAFLIVEISEDGDTGF